MISRVIIDILIVFSLFFAFAGVVGMLRMPDSYCRMQSSTNVATLGVLGVIAGGMIYSGIVLGDASMIVKIAILGIFYIITNPIAGHAISKGAYGHGVRPVKEMTCDKLGEDLEND